MKVQKIKKAMLLFLLPILFACGNKTRIKIDPSDTLGDLDTIEGVGFNQVFNQLLAPQCLECHPGYSNYNAVAAESSKILEQIVTGRMPRGGPAITDENRLSLINSWVQNGAPEEAGGDAAQPISLEPTFNSIFVNILVPKCIACHNGSSQAIAPRFYNFSNYDSFIASNTSFEQVNGFPFMDQLDGAESEIVFLFEDNQMPPTFLPGNPSYNENPLEQLTPNEINVFTQWIENGFPNN